MYVHTPLVSYGAVVLYRHCHQNVKFRQKKFRFFFTLKISCIFRLAMKIKLVCYLKTG